ncbi:hypothetical protein BU25DRAFT_421870 [Macroventuria anomochaeta]|uniref:Uncharacterized protein n=1 Tax=Macroventuria anomochaeta TaxID=301207 RepID=A0ACB6RZK0_9PLEO|nr:uncharacterized protein BU25DRAFT_421870 [Macroventuria anomochaeta]KAF2627455.1 hypothetical protein BU25DRAFT_421870 [Macroventuria anomochaeta]
MHNPFKTQGAAHYIGGCGSSDSSTNNTTCCKEASLSNPPNPVHRCFDPDNARDVIPLSAPPHASPATNTPQEPLTIPSTNPKMSPTASVIELPSTHPTTTQSQYPSGWPPETIASIERAKAAEKHKEEGEKNKTKGATRVGATVEIVAIGLAVGLASLLG